MAVVIVWLVVGFIGLAVLGITALLTKDPWTKGQIERVYGPGFTMGWMVGMLFIVLIQRG